MRTKHTIPMTCKKCGTPFEALPYRRFKGQMRQFCSRECSRTFQRAKIADRFWHRVDRSGECWLWTGGKNHDGYGSFGLATKQTTTAHRYAWLLATGEDPGEFKVLHCCDTPACVRNDGIGTYDVNGVSFPRRGHLWLGTQTDNIADMVAKERQQRRKGSARGKLSAEDVPVIRARRNAGETLQSIANDYGVAKTSIRQVTCGVWRLGKWYRAWDHIPDS